MAKDFKNGRGSIRCGKHVEATVCPGPTKTGPVPYKKELRLMCDLDQILPDDSSKVFEVAPFLADHESVPMVNGVSSIILKYHPWEAKGPAYLKLSRADKDAIVWGKITESDQKSDPVDISEFFKIDMHSVFDEFGDELDCRLKTKHSQGVVAKVYWESTVDEHGNPDHPYTGIF